MTAAASSSRRACRYRPRCTWARAAPSSICCRRCRRPGTRRRASGEGLRSWCARMLHRRAISHSLCVDGVFTKYAQFYVCLVKYFCNHVTSGYREEHHSWNGRRRQGSARRQRGLAIFREPPQRGIAGTILRRKLKPSCQPAGRNGRNLKGLRQRGLNLNQPGLTSPGAIHAEIAFLEF